MSNLSDGTKFFRAKLRPGLELLLEARSYATDTDCDSWDFAVEIDRLRRVGLNESDLRWFFKRGYVRHAKEIAAGHEESRKFVPMADLTFCQTTCFVLTDLGMQWSKLAISELNSADVDRKATRWPQGNMANGLVANGLVANGLTANESASSLAPVPVWKPDIRELYVNGSIVKRFKWQAINQELVLGAFQEDGWPAVIDDPLPPKPEQDSKRRLHDTIKALNRNQLNKVLRFHGNGTGEGIRWNLVEAR